MGPVSEKMTKECQPLIEETGDWTNGRGICSKINSLHFHNYLLWWQDTENGK